jgi:hypothetical protein
MDVNASCRHARRSSSTPVHSNQSYSRFGESVDKQEQQSLFLTHIDNPTYEWPSNKGGGREGDGQIPYSHSFRLPCRPNPLPSLQASRGLSQWQLCIRESACTLAHTLPFPLPFFKRERRRRWKRQIPSFHRSNMHTMRVLYSRTMQMIGR